MQSCFCGRMNELSVLGLRMSPLSSLGLAALTHFFKNFYHQAVGQTDGHYDLQE